MFYTYQAKWLLNDIQTTEISDMTKKYSLGLPCQSQVYKSPEPPSPRVGSANKPPEFPFKLPFSYLKPQPTTPPPICVLILGF